jgi:hypothetical protein
MRPLSLRLVDLPFDCLSMRSMPSGSQAKSASKIRLFDAVRRFASPGVAQVAIQQGRYAGQLIARRISGGLIPARSNCFDKGNLQVIGAGFAVLQTGKVRMHGFLAWLAWSSYTCNFWHNRASARVSSCSGFGRRIRAASVPPHRESLRHAANRSAGETKPQEART